MARIRTLILALAALALAAVPAAAQTTLRYKFKQGDTLNYVMDQKMKINTEVMGKSIDMTMDQTANISWKILEVDGQGNAKIAIKFGRTKLTMDMPMGKVEVDSDSAEEPGDPLGKILYGVVKGMSGMNVTGKINQRGEISDIELPEKVAKELQRIPGAEALGDVFSPEGVKRMMGQSGLVFPKNAVAKGEDWKNRMDMKLPFGKIVADIVYTYQGSTQADGRSLEKITLQPKMAIEPDPNAPFAMKMKTQKGSGHALFNNEEGRLSEMVINQTMEMELEVMGQTISQRMVQNVTTRLVDKK